MKPVKKILKTFTHLHIGYLLGVFVLLLLATAGQLRQNNLHMVKLRQAVIDADANGTDVEKPLQELRTYVTSHMNTNLRSHGKFATNEPPIQLVTRYNQAVQAAQEKAAAANGNASLYVEAENSCKQRAVPLTIIAQCIQEYIAARTNNANPAVAATVPKELYTYDFLSPKWSPDLAGWGVVATTVVGLAVLGRALAFWRKSHLLREV